MTDSDGNLVTFQLLSRAFYYKEARYWPPNIDLAHRDAEIQWFASHYEEWNRLFKERYNGIAKQIFCDNIICSLVLTGTDQIFGMSNETSEDAVELLALLDEMDRLQAEAHRVLTYSDWPRRRSSSSEIVTERARCMERFFTVGAKILSHLNKTYDMAPEDRARARSRDSLIVQSFRTGLEDARAAYLAAAQRMAEGQYVLGMLQGATVCYAVAVLTLAICGLVAWIDHDHFRDLAPLAYTFAAGGTGGVVSVLTRMTFDKLTLEFTVGARPLRRLGAFRPVVGGIFGFVIYLAFASHLLIPSFIGTLGSGLPYFYAFASFLAGFNERLAQDMLTSAGGVLSKSRTATAI